MSKLPEMVVIARGDVDRGAGDELKKMMEDEAAN